MQSCTHTMTQSRTYARIIRSQPLGVSQYGDKIRLGRIKNVLIAYYKVLLEKFLKTLNHPFNSFSNLWKI